MSTAPSFSKYLPPGASFVSQLLPAASALSPGHNARRKFLAYDLHGWVLHFRRTRIDENCLGQHQGHVIKRPSLVAAACCLLPVAFALCQLCPGVSAGSRQKKKTRSTRHQFEPKALSIFFACMLQISADHLSDALSCALHFCSVLFPFVLYPILLPGILASARCQQTKLIFKMAKGGLKGVKGILWVRLFRSKSLTCFAWFFWQPWQLSVPPCPWAARSPIPHLLGSSLFTMGLAPYSLVFTSRMHSMVPKLLWVLKHIWEVIRSYEANWQTHKTDLLLKCYFGVRKFASWGSDCSSFSRWRRCLSSSCFWYQQFGLEHVQNGPKIVSIPTKNM